jgi:Na+-driven multidrug efflux pump
MCTLVLLSGSVLSILGSSAVGAYNPKLAGIYLQVSYYVLSYIMVFVFICWYFCTEIFWNIVGTDDSSGTLVHMAGTYAKILAFSLPGQLIVGQMKQILSSQRIMHPQVNAAVCALI